MAQTFDLADISNSGGATSFASFAKGEFGTACAGDFEPVSGSLGRRTRMAVSERLKWYVLSAVAPLYENISEVGLKVKRWSEKDGFSFSDAEIENALENLISSGFVDCWTLAVNSAENRRTKYNKSENDKLWFLISAQGQQVLVSLDKKLARGPGF